MIYINAICVVRFQEIEQSESIFEAEQLEEALRHLSFVNDEDLSEEKLQSVQTTTSISDFIYA